MILIILILIAQFYVAVWPLEAPETPGDTAESFFIAYLAAPIMLLFWIAGYAWKRQRPLRSHEIDLDTGRKSWLTAEEMRAYHAERSNVSFPLRVYRILFSH